MNMLESQLVIVVYLFDFIKKLKMGTRKKKRSRITLEITTSRLCKQDLPNMQKVTLLASAFDF